MYITWVIPAHTALAVGLRGDWPGADQPASSSFEGLFLHSGMIEVTDVLSVCPFSTSLP